jgi:lysophospholipase L1-like esterase
VEDLGPCEPCSGDFGRAPLAVAAAMIAVPAAAQTNRGSCIERGDPLKAEKPVVLLGDSIIDNGAYVCSGEPDVARQLQTLLPQHTVVKRAVDGATCADVLDGQIGDLSRAERIILSAGGNDALQHIGLLEDASKTTARDVLVRLWAIREEFRRRYAALLDRLALARRPVLVLTVYNPCFHAHGFNDAYQQAAESAISIIDDVIQQEARRRSFAILELRELFHDRADYANPIEPSAIGGAKLAKCMSRWLRSEDDHPSHSPLAAEG